MINIRKGVFETNSSSSHSIVVTKANNDTQYNVDAGWRVDKTGILSFWDDDLEFGRYPFKFLYNWYHRLCYAIASANTTSSDFQAQLDVIRNICKKHINNFKDFKFPIEHSWNENEEDEIIYGWVDHQSASLLDEFLEKYHVDLEDFIFNDNYIVIIDGDEYEIFNDMKEAKIINDDFIETQMEAF